MDALQYGALGLLYVVVTIVGAIAYRIGVPLAREHLKTYKALAETADSLRVALVAMGQRNERLEWSMRAALEMLADLHRAEQGPQRTSDIVSELHEAIAAASETHGGQRTKG